MVNFRSDIMKKLSVILLSLVMSLSMGFAWAGASGSGSTAGGSAEKAGCDYISSPDCG